MHGSEVLFAQRRRAAAAAMRSLSFSYFTIFYCELWLTVCGVNIVTPQTVSAKTCSGIIRVKPVKQDSLAVIFIHVSQWNLEYSTTVILLELAGKA